jgi:arylsulfatase A-like enzyme
LRSASLVQTITTSALLRRLTGIREVAGRKFGTDVNQEFLEWEAKSEGRPWFAFLNYYDAHEPYLPRPPYAGRYSSGLPPRHLDALRYWNVEGGISDWLALDQDAVEAERAAYEEAITGLDADIGVLLAELRRRGVLERTIVVLTSDHGELFGDHNAHAHGNSVFWQTLHVPLVISWPGHLPSGQRVTDVVSLRNIGATILGLAFPEAPGALPGTSLPTADDPARPRDLALSELSLEQFTRDDAPMRNGALQSLVGFDWQYMRAANGHEDVYWTGPGAGAGVPDTLVSVPAVRALIVDSARSRLAAARVPPPPVDSGR